MPAKMKKIYSDEKLNLSQQAIDRFVELARFALKQEKLNANQTGTARTLA
jgi:hypothetical protein